MKRIFNFQFSIFNSSKGFTLMELLVVITIATIVIISVVIQQNKWNDYLVVDSQTYDLALSIRQAQFYSLGVRVDTNSPSGDKFSSGYGIHIDTGSNSQFILFSDRNNNGKYDSGESIETKTLNRGVSINRICSSDSCSNTGGPIRQVGIKFIRPETGATILFLNAGGNQVAGSAPLSIYLRSPGGIERSVKVEANGQVSVSQ